MAIIKKKNSALRPVHIATECRNDLSQFLRKMQQETDNYSGERAVAFAQISKTKRYVFGNDLIF